MKAMEKDRTRRYQTANELAADVKRFLHSEPVLAGPPSAWNTLRKFVRRNKAAAVTALLIVSAVIIGLSIASIGFVRASREAAHSRAVSDFLQSIIIDTERAAPGDVSVDEITWRGRDLFGDDHAIVGNLLTTRASSLATAGRLGEAVVAQREARQFLAEAHGEDHPSVAAATGKLAELLEERRDIKEAEELYREALALKRDIFGDRSPIVADALESLTSLLVESGNPAHDEIKSLWRQTVEAYRVSWGEESSPAVKQLCEMSCWMFNSGYVEEAVLVLPEAVERARDVLREDDMIRFLTMNVYAQSKVVMGKYREAIAIIEELTAAAQMIWKEDSTVEILLRSHLVIFNEITGDREAAERELETLVEMRINARQGPHFMTFQFSQGILERMSDWFDEHPSEGRGYALAIAKDARSLTFEGTEQRAEILASLGRWFFRREFYEDANGLLSESISAYRAAEDMEPADLAHALIYLGHCLVHVERFAEAEPIIRESIEIRSRVLEGERRWLITNSESILGECLAGQGRFEEAEGLLVGSYEELRASILVPADNQRLARERLVDLYERWGRVDEAAKYRAPASVNSSGASS